jgi:hypothetical protein
LILLLFIIINIQLPLFFGSTANETEDGGGNVADRNEGKPQCRILSLRQHAIRGQPNGRIFSPEISENALTPSNYLQGKNSRGISLFFQLYK